MPELQESERTAIYAAVYRAATKALQSVGDPSEMLPAEIDAHRMRLSALYAMLSDEIGKLEIARAQVWIDLKTKDASGKKLEKPLSDSFTDKLYDTTPDGKRRIEAKYCERGLEKVLSALSGHMRRLNEEARGNF